MLAAGLRTRLGRVIGMIRAVRLAAALLFACLGLVATTAASAAAADCTCRQPTLERQVARADVIFIGTVENVEKAGTDWTYDVEATRAYKGEPERSTQVFSAGGAGRCGLGELAVGTDYVFLATGSDAPYEADSCGGTAEWTQGRVDKLEKVPELAAGYTAIEPPAPPEAVRTLVEDEPPAGFARAAAPGAAAAIIGLLGLIVVRRLGRR